MKWLFNMPHLHVHNSPLMINKSFTYITFKSAVKHRQLGYGYPRYIYPAGIGTLIQHRDWILTSGDMKTTLISDRYMYAISIRQKTNVHSTLYFIGDIWWCCFNIFSMLSFQFIHITSCWCISYNFQILMFLICSRIRQTIEIHCI